MPYHFAKVALPLASGQMLEVTQAVSMEGTRAVITADQDSRTKADRTLTYILFIGAFPLRDLGLLNHLEPATSF